MNVEDPRESQGPAKNKENPKNLGVLVILFMYTRLVDQHTHTRSRLLLLL